VAAVVASSFELNLEIVANMRFAEGRVNRARRGSDAAPREPLWSRALRRRQLEQLGSGRGSSLPSVAPRD